MWTAAGLFMFLSAVVTHSMGQYGSQCQLPNQQMGLCMPIRSCKSIFELLEWIREIGGQISEGHRNMLSQRYCGSFKNEHHVCCAESDIQLNPIGLGILKNQTCGLYSTQKVANGKEAPLFAFPWMALLIYNDSSNPYKCGGSIISEQYVLTAAHCARSNLLYVRVGEHRISSERDCIPSGKICAPPVENIEIEEIIKHERFRKFHDDIALLRLNRKVQYQPHIRPLCLPIFDDIRDRTLKEYVISGWGRTESALRANVLMVALVPHVSLTECQSILERFGLRTRLRESEFCAGNSGLVDTCPGDSGGPIGYSTMYDGHPRYVQFGVTSFGTLFCGGANAPTVYTNVSQYMQWITDNIK